MLDYLKGDDIKIISFYDVFNNYYIKYKRKYNKTNDYSKDFFKNVLTIIDDIINQ